VLETSNQPHFELAELWEYRSEQRPLSDAVLKHLFECNDCLALLGMCQCSKSIKEVEKKLKERTQ